MICHNCGENVRLMTRVEAFAANSPRRYIHEGSGKPECGKLELRVRPEWVNSPVAEVECRRCSRGVRISVAAKTGGFCEACAADQHHAA